MTGFALALLLTLSPQNAAQSPADELNAAKRLYASGNYEDALNRLSGAVSETTPDGFGVYRALCLLALGRSDDARRTLGDLVARRPLLQLTENDVSPQVIAMFREVRQQRLPAIAKDLYASAKTAYDSKDYTAALAQFKDLVALAGDADMPQDAATSDLKMLGDGFLKLAEAAAAPARPQPTAPPVASNTPTPAAATTPNEPGRIYGDMDREVRAPVEISRTLPEWRPPNVVAQKQEFRGVIRIVVDERGNVETASLLKSVSDAYDQLLLAAARTWTYRPALRNGQGVKYQKLIEIVLTPRLPQGRQ
jgi:TonB family protein